MERAAWQRRWKIDQAQVSLADHFHSIMDTSRIRKLGNRRRLPSYYLARDIEHSSTVLTQRIIAD